MTDNFAFYLDVEDPESDNKAENAYCVLVEVHTNFRTQALVAVFECWRSRKACLANKKPFNVLEIPLEPDKGGKHYFSINGPDGANMQLASRLRDFCIKNVTAFATAKPANSEEELTENKEDEDQASSEA